MKCFILLLVAAFSAKSVYSADLKITVLYESKSQDSISFFRDQFIKVYANVELLKDNEIEYEMVPYGKTTQTKEDNKVAFKCTGGDKECYGDKIQACALEVNSTVAYGFIYCAMTSSDASDDTTLQGCAKSLKLNWDEVIKCVTDKGDVLLAKMGERTKELAPENKIESLSIPTIIFNDKYDERIQNLAVKDLLDVTKLQLDYVKGGSEKLAPFGLAIFFVALFQYFA